MRGEADGLKLVVEAVETIPLRVDLDRDYRGSFYHMARRATIITRIRTTDGIVGETYNADSDSEQHHCRL